MASNTVLNNEDKKKLYKAENKKNEQQENTFSAKGELKKIKNEYQKVLNGNKKNLVSKFRNFLDQLSEYVKLYELNEYPDVSNSLERIDRNLRIVDRKLKNKEITKVTEFLEKLKKYEKKLNEISIEEIEGETRKYAEELGTVDLSNFGKRNSVFTANIPVVLKLKDSPDRTILKRVKSEINFVSGNDAYYIKDALFVVGRKSMMHQKYNYKDQLSAVVKLLNDKTYSSYVCVHDIGKESGKFVLSLVIPSRIAKPFSEIIDKVKESKILVNM